VLLWHRWWILGKRTEARKISFTSAESEIICTVRLSLRGCSCFRVLCNSVERVQLPAAARCVAYHRGTVHVCLIRETKLGYVTHRSSQVASLEQLWAEHHQRRYIYFNCVKRIARNRSSTILYIALCMCDNIPIHWRQIQHTFHQLHKCDKDRKLVSRLLLLSHLTFLIVNYKCAFSWQPFSLYVVCFFTCSYVN